MIRTCYMISHCITGTKFSSIAIPSPKALGCTKHQHTQFDGIDVLIDLWARDQCSNLIMRIVATHSFYKVGNMHFYISRHDDFA